MSKATVSAVDVGAKKVAKRVTVNAPAAEIFALVADPHRHHELDGSGTIRDVPITGPHHLTTGDKFSVGMKQYGVPYKITSTATEVQEGAVVEWQHPLGHRWRWDLVETTPGTTEVTETFDYSTAKLPLMISAFGFERKNAEGITATLERLAGRFAS